MVAGVMLGNLCGGLNLSKARLLDFALMVERHPDNVAAALYGGFVGTYLNELDSEDMARKEVPLSEVLPQPAGGVDSDRGEVVQDIVYSVLLRWAVSQFAIFWPEINGEIQVWGLEGNHIQVYHQIQ